MLIARSIQKTPVRGGKPLSRTSKSLAWITGDNHVSRAPAAKFDPVLHSLQQCSFVVVWADAGNTVGYRCNPCAVLTSPAGLDER
jgi:hypothetical protein